MRGGLFNDAPRVTIKNVSGEIIPARSFVKVAGGTTATTGKEMINGTIPDGAASSVYVVSGHAAIPIGGVGYGFWPVAPVWVKYSTAPSPVEEIGPADASWEADPDGGGFDCLRVRDGLALIIRGASTSSGGGESSPCGCGSFIEVGTSSCQDTNDSPSQYIITSLGVLGDNVALNVDTPCQYFSDDLEYDCYGA